MSIEHEDDPCRDLEPASAPSGGNSPPPIIALEPSDHARFPTLETQFAGEPISRSCVMIPRSLYYSKQEGTRKPSLAVARASTMNSPLPPETQDVFRYLAGKVYNIEYQNGVNYIQNPIAEESNEFSGVYLEIRVRDTEHVFAIRDSYEHTFNNRVQAIIPFNQAYHLLNAADDSGEHPQVSPEGLMAYFGRIIPRPEQTFTAGSFRAPASFFAKEADILNLRLPDLTTIQVFVPNQMTFEEQRMDYESVHGAGDRDPLTKESVYKRFAKEYKEMDYQQGCRDSQVHKFPADQVIEMNEITEIVTQDESLSPYASFKRVFDDNFSIYSRVAFDSNHESEIARILKEKKLDALFLSFLDIDSPSKLNMYAQILDEKIEDFYGDTSNDGVSLEYYPNSYGSVFTDMSDLIGNRVWPPENLHVPLDLSTFPLSHEGVESYREQLRSNTPIYSLEKALGLGFAQGQIHDFLINEEKDRTFKKIFQNTLAHSEVVAYRVEKMDAITGEVIQNFYFFNDPTVSRIDFLDSQVLYGARYVYRIYCINAVIGSKYNYSMIEQNDLMIADGYIGVNINIEQKRDIVFVETPYHQQEVLIVDAPPLPPDVWFLPYSTRSEEVLWFWFSPRLGEYEEYPIAIFEEDLETIERMKLSQNVPAIGDQKIRYKSDSDPSHYQILTLDSPPNSYQDFLLGKLDETTIAAPEFKKTVTPNKDYYITFRTKDLAGISNPTKVFKYRLVSRGDTVPYHELEEYNFSDLDRDPEISFDRALRIRVAANQRHINFEGAPDYGNPHQTPRESLETTRGVDNLSLGPSDEEISIWNRRFIFELASVSSGRRLRVEAEYQASSMDASGEELPPNAGNVPLPGFSIYDQTFRAYDQFCIEESDLEEQRRRIQEANLRRINDRGLASGLLLPPSARARVANPVPTPRGPPPVSHGD